MSFKSAILDRLPAAWAGRLRALRVRWMVRTFRKRVVEHAYGRERLRVWLTDPLAEGWYDADWGDPPELVGPVDRLHPGARIFDLGAHQGVLAMVLARQVMPDGLVVAVEANPHNAAVARRNVALNQVPVEVLHAAVTDRPGTVILNAGLNGRLDDGSGVGGRIAVPAVTIDGLAERFGPPALVTIDVEGAEVLALRGARGRCHGRCVRGRGASGLWAGGVRAQGGGRPRALSCWALSAAGVRRGSGDVRAVGR